MFENQTTSLDFIPETLLTIKSPLSESKAILLVYFCRKRNVVYFKSE